MWRRMAFGLAVAAGLFGTAPAASAQDSSLAVNLGYFVLKGQDSRVAGDILNAERCIGTTGSCDPLLFDVKDFNNGTVGADWVVGLGDYFEASAGVGIYQRTVPSVYEFLTDSDGSEIEQDLKLRVIPFTATLRFVPTSRLAAVQPYIGVGVAVMNWRYTETGDFVDSTDDSIFRNTYEATGTKTAPVIVGGVKAPIGGNKFLLGGEVRYVKADVAIPEGPDDFVSDRLDLGGFTYSAVLQFRF